MKKDSYGEDVLKCVHISNTTIAKMVTLQIKSLSFFLATMAHRAHPHASIVLFFIA